MDTYTTARPTLLAFSYLTSTAVKPTASRSHHTLRHAQETQVQFTALKQVQKHLDIHIVNLWKNNILTFQLRETTLNPFFSSGLCAPSNVTVSPACEDSVVSWSHVTGAEMSIATATADDGHTHTCSSNYSCSCNLTDLHCGETYAVTVVTVDRGCWSKPSSAVELRTGERKL